MTGPELVAAYDADEPIPSTRLFEFGSPKEHLGQRIAIETLRALVASGLTVQQYNDMDELEWAAMIVAAARRARGGRPETFGFVLADYLAAGNLGGCFFEQGHKAVMDATTPADEVVLTRTGGIR